MNPQPKTRPWRSEPYRRLVAALPCIRCGLEGWSQAAHGPSLGRGIKAGDDTCMPLCARSPGCHWAFDNYVMFGLAERRVKAIEWAAETRARLRPECERLGIKLPEDIT